MNLNHKLLFLTLLIYIYSYNLVADTGRVNALPVYDNNKLPDWIFNNNGAFGVSDINMDSVTAVNQAINRALAFYAMSNAMSIESVYEYYYHVENYNNNCVIDNQKSHWMAVINADLNNYIYEIDNIYYSNYYNEAFVSLSVSIDNNSDNQLTVNGNLLFYYDYHNQKCIYGESDTLIINTPSEAVNYSMWVSKISDNADIKESVINGGTNKIKNYGCNYSDSGSSCDNAVFANQNYGFWNAYIDTFIQALTNYESSKKIIKKTSQYITKEYDDFSDKNQNIVRSIIKTRIGCSLTAMSMKNNYLYTNWKIEEK